MRIGDMPLTPLDDKVAGQAATPTILYDIAKRSRVGRLANNAHVGMMTIRRHPLDHFDCAVDGVTLFIAGDQQADRSLRFLYGHTGNGGDKGSNAAFHVSRAAAIKPAILNHRAKWIMCPGIMIANRNNIRMACKAEMRAIGATTGKKIVDPVVTLAEGTALTDKAKRRQLIFKTVQRTALMRGHRRTADQPLCQVNSI
jgi:hypothetical protein